MEVLGGDTGLLDREDLLEIRARRDEGDIGKGSARVGGVCVRGSAEERDLVV